MVTRFSDVIPHDPSWDVIDPSKLTTYLECPRKFFYSHLLGWSSTRPNVHLTFGTAWHAAVEYLLNTGYGKEQVEEAAFLFLQKYREVFNSDWDDINEPKSASNGMAGIMEYANRFRSDAEKYEVIATEVGGIVLIGPDKPMAFRIDAVMAENESSRVIALDHKTSQYKTNFWGESWNLSTQMLTYLHVLYCMFGEVENRVKGIRIRGAWFYKAKAPVFDETIVEKTYPQMQNWLASINIWYDTLKADFKILQNNESVEESVMFAFPMNEKSCFLYNRPCAYFDYCNSWSNPLQKCDMPPTEFEVKYWNPLADEKIKHKVDLTKEGINESN
jgi:PD-(D/E)XK nuclease superfamily